MDGSFFIVFLPQVQIKKEENRNAVNNTKRFNR